jgi:hypothetical protein
VGDGEAGGRIAPRCRGAPSERLRGLPDHEDDAFIDMVHARVAASEAGAPGHPVEEVLARARLRAR